MKRSESAAQSCPALCDPTDCSPPGSSARGILQARILEWVAISFSRGSSQLRVEPWSPALQADSLPFEPAGKSKSPKRVYQHILLNYTAKVLCHQTLKMTLVFRYSWMVGFLLWKMYVIGVKSAEFFYWQVHRNAEGWQWDWQRMVYLSSDFTDSLQIYCHLVSNMVPRSWIEAFS